MCLTSNTTEPTALQRLMEFKGGGSEDVMMNDVCAVTLTGLDIITILAALKHGYKTLSDTAAALIFNAVWAEDAEAGEAVLVKYKVGRSKYAELADVFLTIADDVGITSASVGNWLEGLVADQNKED